MAANRTKVIRTSMMQCNKKTPSFTLHPNIKVTYCHSNIGAYISTNSKMLPKIFLLSSLSISLAPSKAAPSEPPIGVAMTFFKHDNCDLDEDFVARMEYVQIGSTPFSTYYACDWNYQYSSVRVHQYPKLDGSRRDICNVTLFEDTSCEGKAVDLVDGGGSGGDKNCWGAATGMGKWQSWRVVCNFEL